MLPLRFVKGTAEIFGAELAEGKTYLFGEECKAAVYTWHGCTIQMSPISLYASLDLLRDRLTFSLFVGSSCASASMLSTS